MASLSVSDFNKLTAFFKALQDINFNPTKPIPSSTKINGRPTPVDKLRSLELLRSFGGLKGKDDSEIIKFLAKPGNRGGVLGSELTRAQQIELAQALTDKPAAAVAAQPAGQAIPVEQAVPVGAATGTSTGSTPFGMPSAPSIPIFRPIQRTAQPGEIVLPKETVQPIKTEVPEAFQKAFENEPDYEQALSSENKLDPTKKPPQPQAAEQNTSRQRFNFRGFNMPNSIKNLGSSSQILIKRGSIRVGRGLGGMIKSGLESANPFLGRAGNGLVNGLGNIANPGGIGGNNGIMGRLKGAGKGVKPKGGSLKNIKKGGKGFLLFFIVILLLMALVGTVALTGDSQQPSPSSPPIISTDISNCKFTRGAEAPSAVKFQSNSLLSYIQEAANKSTLPPAVLAAFIRVESPSSSVMSDEQITNYATNCAVSPTGALGIMQIQPPGTTSLKGDPASCDDCIDAGAKLIGKTVSTMTTADYCDPRTSIIVGAGWILKKMTYLGYGDGAKWDTEWTNNRPAIEALVNTYYGGLLYPDYNEGPYNYADDVSTSIQGCVVSSPGTVPPLEGRDYIGWVKTNFNTDVSALPAPYPQWAYEILSLSTSVAPKFQNLISTSLTTVIPVSSGSHTSGSTVYIRTGYNVDFFKQIFIHELAHRIKGSAGTPSPVCQSSGQTIEQVEAEGYLTYYAEHATPPDITSPACGNNDQTTRSDEDFAESVSYYINDIMELPYGSGCSTYSSSSPYNRGDRPAHKAYIQCLLGP